MEVLVDDDGTRLAKRRKTNESQSSTQQPLSDGTLTKRHPLRVRPSGNALTAESNLKASCGLFALLPDELLVQFLEILNVPHLLRLGATCKALHAFTRNEELWRALFVE
jgi:hypothetical protein